MKLADRRMREINQAWSVLGDRAARRRYDEALQRGERMGPAARSASPPPKPRPKVPAVDEDDDLVDAAPHLGTGGVLAVRGLPWIVLIAVLVLIFVITAFAKGGGHTDSQTPTLSAGSCFTVSAEHEPVAASCGVAHAVKLVSRVEMKADCPAGTEERTFGAQTEKWCVKPS
jgi:hypothetical protein